jgi:peptidoglycan/xylan/chitin deacetylase (PgdA/CDA1 family)
MKTDDKSTLPPIFTSSWDDGHPLDMRLAEMLALHGFNATIYVPLSNREGLPVMTGAQLRELQAGGLEIGSHTLDHCYLTTVDDATAKLQIIQGKTELENALGQAVPGFCYPGGKYHKRHVKMVDEAGFRYARHIVNLHADVAPNPFAMPVSIQLYPHRPDVYLRNFVLHGSWRQRTRMLAAALSQPDLLSRLKSVLDVACMQNGVFHLWGHSWELDLFDGWPVLDLFLRYAAERIPPENRLSNMDTLLWRQVLVNGTIEKPFGSDGLILRGSDV